MKYIGIDYGTKKIGVAVSDETGSLAFPHSVVPAGASALAQVAALAKESGAEVVVLGESRDFAGAPNLVMKEIGAFKKGLEELGFKV